MEGREWEVGKGVRCHVEPHFSDPLTVNLILRYLGGSALCSILPPRPQAEMHARERDLRLAATAALDMVPSQLQPQQPAAPSGVQPPGAAAQPTMVGAGTVGVTPIAGGGAPPLPAGSTDSEKKPNMVLDLMSNFLHNISTDTAAPVVVPT